MDKKQKKELLKKYAEEQKNNFINSLPFKKSLFEKLFDYLDENLENHECDHSYKLTINFLKEHNLPVEKSLEWMKSNGGFCDCEVLWNIEDKIQEI